MADPLANVKAKMAKNPNVGPNPRSSAALAAVAQNASDRNRALATQARNPVQSAISSGDPMTMMREMVPQAISGIVASYADLAPEERDPSVLLDALAGGAKIYATLSDIEREGRAQLDDGSYISMADLKSSDPAIRAQATAAMYQLGQSTLKNGNALLVMAGMDPIPGMDGGAGEAAARAAAQDFANRMAQLDAKIALDKVGLERASAETARALGGLQESRGRADLVTQRLIESAPYNTGGRTTFGGGDFGAIGQLALRQAGIANPEAVGDIVRYPSSVTVDPGALMAGYDRGLGVSGALPAIPSLLAGAGDIPGLPMTYAGGGGIDLAALPRFTQGAAAPSMSAPPLVGEYDQTAREGRLAY